MPDLIIKHLQINAVGYVRKSDDDKDNTQLSLRNQEILIANHCKDNNKNLLKMFYDADISGSDRDRKDFNDMVKLAKTLNSGFNEIIVKDTSRFSRDGSFFRDTLKDLNAWGVKLFSLLENKYIDPDDIETIVKTTLIDEAPIIKGKKDAEETIKLKIRNRLPYGSPPFGYIYNYNKKFVNSQIKKEPINKDKPMETWIIYNNNGVNKAIIVKKIFEMTKQGLNYKDCCNQLKISFGMYWRIIKNKTYTGICSIKRSVKDSNKNIIRTYVQEWQCDFEPIISKELYEDVQKIRKDKNLLFIRNNKELKANLCR